MSGRFAPSPTGDLHLGNLRTALVAWLSARSHGLGFLVRMEDLDRGNSSIGAEQRQLADLAALGLDWDGPVVRQSERFARYDEALAELQSAGLLYPCFCSRREIREAALAPHGAEAAYPGTCRGLPAAERSRRAVERPAALRLRTEGEEIAIHDAVAGRYAATLDDFVVRRNDGVPAYHLAVVVDDADQSVTEVVRGDDLLPSTPRHVHLQRLLGLPTPIYRHLPLVVGSTGERLAKRDGAVTLGELAVSGVTPALVRSALAGSLGLSRPGEPIDVDDLLDRFGALDPESLGGPAVALVDLERCWAER